MNCSLGKIFHNNSVAGNISALHAIAQPSNAFQISRWDFRHSSAAHAAAATITISNTATHEMIRLNASWSASLV